MSTSAFGVDHGEISKGLPSAVKAGGGGGYGSLLRLKNAAGKSSGRLLGSKAHSETHASSLKYLAASEKNRGKNLKGVVEQSQFEARVRQPHKTRRIRAELLSADSAARRAGFKTGKSSALDRGYRGRVGTMKELP